jgi:hypothetical protein
MSRDAWRHLEQRVAHHFERNGYTARTNQVLRAPNGQPHEIDVLAERRDAAGTHRVAVECKAWQSPIDKDVVYKLHQEMADLGLTKGIIVSVGGFKCGARAAAEQRHIEIWGPDEIRHLLGDDALAGVPLRAPATALGVPVTTTQEAAAHEIRKARGGFAGIGAEEVASVELVWVPAIELQLAITRTRPGIIREKEELIRRWLLFETLTGRLLGALDDPRTFEEVPLAGPVVRQQRSPAQIVTELRKTLGKHRNAKSDAAQASRQTAYNAVGLPGSAREFAVEAEKAVFVPFYVGSLRRKASERLVAIHAGACTRVEAVERALHDKVDLLHAARDDAVTEAAPTRTEPIVAEVAEATVLPKVSAPPTCNCGQAMVLRQRKADGQPFWGCSTFPRCRRTLPIT